MGTISVEVDTDEVLNGLSDKELLAEVAARKLDPSGVGGRLDDLERALRLRDWAEVEYLVRTYVFPTPAKGYVGPRAAIWQQASQ